MRQILAVEVLSPGWLSVRLLSWLCTIAAGTASTLMWLNLRGFGDVLDPITRDRMFVGTSLVTASAVIFLGLGLAHLGRRGGRTSAAILSTTIVLSVAAPIVARGPGRQPPVPAPPPTPAIESQTSTSDSNVRMVMLDGASLEVIFSSVAAGRLPNIGRILDKGAVLHLATLRPTQAEPVWSAIATGRYPMSNGVRSAVVYRALGGTPIQLLPDYCFAQALVTFGFLSEHSQNANDLLTRPIWNILSDRGASVGVIGWPLTQPAPAVNGFVVSDAFHRLPETELSLDATPALWPPELLAEALAALQIPADPDPVLLVTAMGAPQPVNDYDVRSDRAPIVADRVHLQLLNALETPAPRLLAVTVSRHRCGRPSVSALCGSGRIWRCVGSRARKFGGVLNQYYGFIDTLVGREIERLGPNDLLLVVSAFGWSRSRPVSACSRSLPAIRRSAALTSARLTASCSRSARTSRPAARHARRWSISRRRSCIFSGCPSAATWMASRESTCSILRSRVTSRSPTSRRTDVSLARSTS